jgi:hypothetical protein
MPGSESSSPERNPSHAMLSGSGREPATSSREGVKPIPRIIWMMWIQGLDAAPRIVKECNRSWVERNPGWEVRMLDLNSFREYVDLDAVVGAGRADLGPAHLADIIRINLIADHGGVWVDGTCFCVRPLDEWLDDYCRAGFFAFLGHRKDTPVSNWFMASHPGCYLTQTIRNEVNQFWKNNSYPPGKQGVIYRMLKKLLNQNQETTRYWFSWPVRKGFKVLPYFWFHYMFASLLRADDRFRKIWEDSPKLDAVVPHKLRTWGLLEPVTAEARKVIDDRKDKVYKLTWKLKKFDAACDGNTFPDGSHLDYVLRSLDRAPARAVADLHPAGETK